MIGWVLMKVARAHTLKAVQRVPTWRIIGVVWSEVVRRLIYRKPDRGPLCVSLLKRATLKTPVVYFKNE